MEDRAEEKVEQMIERARSAHQGDLFLADFTIENREKEQVRICFVYREPQAGEAQNYQEMVAKDQQEAAKWLTSQVAVATLDERGINEIIGKNTIAYSTFFTEYFNPLFGRVVSAAPLRKL